MENFEMLKALYDFQAVYPKTISFDEGEYFILYQTSARQRNWWQVVNMKGNIGFVPSNYVIKLKVEPNFLIGFLESSIESLEKHHEVDINGIMNRDELLEKLKEKKQSIEETYKLDNTYDDEQIYPKEKNSLPIQKKLELNKKSMSTPSVGAAPQHLIPESPSMSVLNTKLNDITQDNSITEPSSEPSEATTTPTTTSEDVVTVCKDKTERNYNSLNSDDLDTFRENPERNASPVITNENCNGNYKYQECKATGDTNFHKTINVESHDVYQIIDIVRRNTNLSFDLSCEALRVVLSSLEEIFPNEITPYLEAVAMHVSDKLDIPSDLLGDTHDSKRLQYIFSQLAECKNDSEQRTWMLFEDQEDIIQFLEELLDILKNADEAICCHEMSCDQYQSLINLVQYYQMETRWPIKMLLIKVFVAACRLDHIIVDILITSVLPLELIQDFKTNFSDIDKIKEIIKLLTVILSLGQPMPVNHQEHLGSEFILFLIDIIEGNTDQQSDYLIDLVLCLVLAFNLQFNDSSNNIVIEAMQKLSTAKVFTEKILLYLNREDDPAKLLKHSSSSINSVLKIFIDIFSNPETANLFYTNDTKVLIDILVRQLSDLSAGDDMRRHYLELCRRILRNTNYQEHTHRKQDLMKIFTRIFCEETECSASDQQLVRDIANEFPHIFKA